MMDDRETNWIYPQVGAAAAMIFFSLATAFVAADSLSGRTGGQQVGPVARPSIQVEKIDAALGKADLAAARRAWHAAYLEALGNRSWEDQLRLGNASLRIGRAAGDRAAAEARARGLYLTALLRAREQGSLEGVLRAGEAFAALGDREVADRSARIAEDLAARAGDPGVQERLRLVRTHLLERVGETGIIP